VNRMETRPITSGCYLIDLKFLGNENVIAAYLLYDGKEAALIEVGPGSTINNLIEGIQATGVPFDAIRHLIVTHIHLDHAGALGTLAQQLPNAKVYVHPVGAPHLIDPTKLINSAARLYGSLMGVLWGEILPVPEERIVILQDGQTFQVAGRTLTAYDTPGHARHHHAYWEPQNGLLFAGDAAGVRLPGYTYVRPPTPPPELDLEAWYESLQCLQQLPIRQLCLTHFGAFENTPDFSIAQHFDELKTRLHSWGEVILKQIEAGKTEPEIIEHFQRYVQDEMVHKGIEPSAYDLAASYRMLAPGYLRYWQKILQQG
jgi:glyoxylase-like metal-dependent hydrolase (beta-lactamase superfamily II)